uniref:Uncharacterized protein n=1 Tax=Chelonoidis abingdonii TaxID=106734 RepID=A0A8C0GVN4_CHEAB
PLTLSVLILVQKKNLPIEHENIKGPPAHVRVPASCQDVATQDLWTHVLDPWSLTNILTETHIMLMFEIILTKIMQLSLKCFD